MSVSNIIKQIEETSLKIKTVDLEINDLQNSVASETENVLNGFNLLKNNVQTFLSSIKNIVEQVKQIYSNDIKVENNRLVCSQNNNEQYLFNVNNVNEVFQKIQNGLIDGLKKLYINFSLEQLSIICKMYNTILDINDSLNNLQNEKLAEVKNSSNEKLKKLNDEVFNLKSTKEKLNKQLLSIINTNESAALPCIDDSLKFEKTYREKVEIPFAVLTTTNFELINTSKEVLIDKYYFNLSENGILQVKSNSKDFSSKSLVEISENLIIRELVSYPSFSKKFVICDATNNFELRSFIAKISGKAPNLIMKNSVTGDDIFCNEEAVALALDEVSKIINNRVTILGRSGCESILEYNSKFQDNVQPLIFIVLFGYPHGFSYAQKYLDSILTNGKRASVYFTIFTNKDIKLESWQESKFPEIENYSNITCDYDNLTNTVIIKGQNYTLDKKSTNFDVLKLLDEIIVKKDIEESFVDLKKILQNDNLSNVERRENFSKELVLPIGKMGNNIINVSLDSEGDPHAIMCGATGSGKSSLLNTFILSAASLYSPQELEIYIFAMIKSEMVIYKERKLPHLKTIITNDDVIGANEILEYLLAEQQRREKIFASKGNIVQYNASVDKNSRLPRMLIIIDEYQKLVDNDNALSQICSLAQSGRSCGMSLILSSTTVPTLFNKQALTNFAHKFEFKSTTAGELIREADSRKSELDSLKGLCLYTSKNNSVGADLVRIAYWDKSSDGLENIIDDIVRKNNNYKMSLNNSIESQLINTIDNLPLDFKKSKRAYDDDGICNIPLGTQYLSNMPINFAFSSNNNKLCLCGDYLNSKTIEIALIKEFLRLSTDAKCKTVYYIDFNQNPNWRRKENTLKPLINDWTLKSNGRFAYYPYADGLEACEEIEEIIKNRQDIMCEEFSPILVVLSCIENINLDIDEELNDKLEWILKSGRSANIYFAIQFNEFYNRGNSIYRSLDGGIKDAIILPDKKYEDEKYSSTKMVEFLERTQACETSARGLVSSLKIKAFDDRMCLLCNNNKHYCFVPYKYTEEFFKNLKF